MKTAGLLYGEEQVAPALSQLYEQYGYMPYKMRKFEEYDLYVQNKSFLVSDSVLTFTDTSGKLMALKPDVTLSIVRSSKKGELSKVCYNEKVYRPDKRSKSFKEITQVGLESIGGGDLYTICEVVGLALRSLALLSNDYMLDISQLDLISYCLEKATNDPALQEKLLSVFEQKAAHELRALCAQNGVGPEQTEHLTALCSLEGAPEETLPVLSSMYADPAWQKAVSNFKALLDLLPKDCLRVDFSVAGDRNYYNGVVFRGFIKGVPDSLLSGGQYDKLMRKMGKDAPALGFAVYLDEIERLCPRKDGPDADVLILYDGSVPPKKLRDKVEELISRGKKVLAASSKGKITCKETIDLRERSGL